MISDSYVANVIVLDTTPAAIRQNEQGGESEFVEGTRVVPKS